MNYSKILSSSKIVNLEQEIDKYLAQKKYKGKEGYWRPQGGPWYNKHTGHTCQLMIFSDK